MPVVLSHNSSLELLRAAPPQTKLLTRVTEPVHLDDLPTSARSLSDCSFFDLGLRTQPVHVLVSENQTLPKVSGVKAHACRLPELPASALMRYTKDVYLCGPEFTFVQMASVISPLGAAVLGYELCGAYSQFAPLISGFYDRPPLATRASIRAMADALGRTRGTHKARQALKYVCDGSRSPMETVASCMMFFPVSVGGLGFGAPKLNHRVTLDPVAARITGTKTCAIDIAWPDVRLGIEYDSESFHADADKDRRRREALAHMGWSIYVIELDEIRDYRSFSRKVELFEDQVPHVRGLRSHEADRRALLERLLKATRFGMGLESLLFVAAPRKGSVRLHL